MAVLKYKDKNGQWQSIASATKQELDNKVDKVSGKQLSTEDFTTALKTKLEGLSNYDDAAIQQAVAGLQTQLNTLVSGDAASAIESFNEIIAFLDGVQDTETLDGIIASIEQQIAAKYTKPSTGIPKGDLAAAVQASLGKADTALQSHQSLDGYVKDTDLATVATSGNYTDLSNKPTIPTALSDLTADASHRTVTDAEKSSWNAKSNFSGSYNDLTNKPTIPSAVTESTVSGWGFTKNTGTYSKPSGGIPKSDLASAVQTSLGKADTALQSYTETDPTVPSWAKAASKPTYTASEVGAVPATRKVNGKALSADITLSASDVSALPNTTVIPTKVSQLTNDSNFTSNTGTITGITMNGASKGTSGVVNLGTVITAHQDISGKQDKLVSGTSIKTINGTSLLGSGNVEIDANTSTPIVNHGTSDTSFALTPNVFHKWGTVSSLSLTLATPSDQTILNEYMFEFVSGSTATSLTLPSTVKWTSELFIEANKTYQVSIIDNLGVIGGF